MGINVRVESETGLSQAEVLDPENLTQHLLPALFDSEWTCLRFVDRVGDVVFNQLQVPVPLSELRRRIESLRPGQVKAREHGEAIMRLVQEWEGRTYTYVRFIGD